MTNKLLTSARASRLTIIDVRANRCVDERRYGRRKKRGCLGREKKTRFNAESSTANCHKFSLLVPAHLTLFAPYANNMTDFYLAHCRESVCTVTMDDLARTYATRIVFQVRTQSYRYANYDVTLLILTTDSLSCLTYFLDNIKLKKH